MKTKLLRYEFILAVLLVFAQKGLAQYREVRVGVGHESGYFISRELEDDGFILHDSKFSILKNELVKYLEFSLPAGKRMTIQIAVAHSSFTFLNTYSYGKKIKNEYRQINFTTGLRYFYSNDAAKRCKLYSSLDFGLSFKKQRTSGYNSDDKINSQYSYNDINSVIHFNLIGVSTGKRVGAYAELGYGFKGLVNAGIFFRP